MARKAKIADPVFARIETHRKAVKAESRAQDSLDRLKSRLDKRKDQQRLNMDRRLTCRTPLYDVGGSTYDPFDVMHSRAQCASYVRTSFERLTRSLGPVAAKQVARHEKTALKELQRSYDAFQQAHKAKRKTLGLTALEDVVDAAYWPLADALKSLLEKPPVTVEGRKALATYLGSLSAQEAPWWAVRKSLPLLAG